MFFSYLPPKPRGTQADTFVLFLSAGDMIDGTENNQVCLVYGDRWRLHRRLMVCGCSCEEDSDPCRLLVTDNV
jgi:hypothetical protein